MGLATDVGGWKLHLPVIYGRLWEQRARFHLREWLVEAPSSDLAVLFYGIGEVGVNKQVGKLAVFRNKAAPELVLRPKRLTFWVEGLEPVSFDAEKQLAFVSEYVCSWWSKSLSARPRVIDLVKVRLLPPRACSG